jgi:hypothetical protein
MVRISNYGRDTQRETTRTAKVELGPLAVWFSYQTPVAFYTDADGLVVTAERHSNTTTRHMSHIGVPREARIDPVEFDARLRHIVALIDELFRDKVLRAEVERRIAAKDAKDTP